MSKEQVQLILAIVFGSLFVLLLMVAVVMLFRIYLKRKNKLLLEKQRMAIEFEQTLLQSKLEIQEDTFTHISRELHDNVGQVLSLVSINLNTLNAPNEDDKLKLMDDMLSKAMADLRSLSRSLDAEHIRNKGWQEPVQNLFRQLKGTGKYSTEVTIDEYLPQVGGDRSIILFRMIQEVVNNIVKHAVANKISFAAINSGNTLDITIRDNGKGFDSKLVSDGTGLRNLQNRSNLIGSDLSIDSEEGTGTTITISIKP